MIDTEREISFGQEGEYLAKCYLERKGYIFIRTNYWTKHGEIDLIMQDKDDLVFVEVKTRTFHSASIFGRATKRIDDDKKRHIKYASKVFRGIEKRFSHLTPRYDEVEIYIDTDHNNRIVINHIEAAFY